MFDRAPTFHVGAHIFGLRIFCTSAVTFGLRIICVWRSCFLDLEYFISANISHRTPTFWHVFVMACQYHQPCQYGRHAAHIS